MVNVAVIMDPIEQVNISKDSTYAMILAADKRGWTIDILMLSDLFLENGQAMAQARRFEHTPDHATWFQLSEPKALALSDYDVILMRKDPPVDAEFIYATHILQRASDQGTLVVNDPRSLRDCNEKLFATEFPDLCPPGIVTRNVDQLRAFLRETGDIILKPLDGMGGASIFRVTEGDTNFNVIVETISQGGTQMVMAQKFVPEISEGDKRILLINGRPIPFALARIPSAGENRGNLAAGGRGVAMPLTDQELEICERVGPTLKSKGLIFVGLDVIGGYLTEINVTSPTCIQEIDRAFNTGIADKLMDEIENLLN